MKKLVLIALIASAGALSAQQFGVEAGYVTSKVNNDDPALGFQAGPVGSFDLIGPLGFEYGIKYQLLTKDVPAMAGTTTYTGHFVEVPLNLNVNFPLTNDLNIFAFGGPNIDFGLLEQRVNVTNVFGSEVTTTTNIYEVDANDDDLPDNSRFNLQLGVGGGIEYYNLKVKAGYNWGMNDLSNLDNVVNKRNQFTISLGFVL